MATRSNIGVMHGDVCKYIYCHWDGYPEHTGKILLEHYGSVKANQLISLGNLSVLGANIGTKHSFDGQQDSSECTFYGRDRGEEDQQYSVAHSLNELLEYAEEYVYIMKDGVWYMCEGTELRLLSDVLASLEEVA